MTTNDGHAAAQPYRARVGSVWYWVDPTVQKDQIEPGDTVLVYAADAAPHLAVLESPFGPTRDRAEGAQILFLTLEGDRFALPARDIVALHLAAVDDEQ